MVTSVKLIFFHLQMLIEVIHTFIYHPWMYIISLYIGYMTNI
jgi:hypothetical protein